MPKLAAPLEVKPTYWTVRVVWTILRRGNGGRSITVSDYVFDKTASGWRFVRHVPLMSID
ncbi:hypothetical protein D3C83_196910 [compost metagenome]